MTYYMSFFLMSRLPLGSTLFPYTTLFRSCCLGATSSFFLAAMLRLGHEARKSRDRKSTRLNSSHRCISYAVFCLKKKKQAGGGRRCVNEQCRRSCKMQRASTVSTG